MTVFLGRQCKKTDLVYVQVGIGLLQGLGGIVHGGEHGSVRVGRFCAEKNKMDPYLGGCKMIPFEEAI